MNQPPFKKLQLPLIRLNLVQPFLGAAVAAGANVDRLLEPYGVTTQAFANPEMFLPAPTLYDVVEALSAATGDPYIGVHLGAQLAPFRWSPLTRAAEAAQSVGDLLLRLSLDAQKDTSSVVHRLETNGKRASFAEKRTRVSGRKSRHNDGFSAAYILAILRSATGKAWDGSRVVVAVCDPSVFPSDYMEVQLAEGDTHGFSVSFPCDWLLMAPHLEPPEEKIQLQAGSSEASRTPLEALHMILLTNLHDPSLNAERVASLCGVSKRTLARRMSGMGTSLKAEVDALRQAQAEKELQKSHRTVAAIGASLGYPNPSVFIRAFTRWTGQTPKRFRDSPPAAD